MTFTLVSYKAVTLIVQVLPLVLMCAAGTAYAAPGTFEGQNDIGRSHGSRAPVPYTMTRHAIHTALRGAERTCGGMRTPSSISGVESRETWP